MVSSDFSPASWKAFQVGIGLRQKYGANLSVVHVYPTEDDSNVSSDLKRRISNIKNSMDKMSAEFNGNDFSGGKGQSSGKPQPTKIQNIVIPGNIDKELLKFVKDEKFDLVIMGINGNGEDSLPGSHTSIMLEKSTSPVLVIPNNYGSND